MQESGSEVRGNLSGSFQAGYLPASTVHSRWRIRPAVAGGCACEMVPASGVLPRLALAWDVGTRRWRRTDESGRAHGRLAALAHGRHQKHKNAYRNHAA